MSGTGYQASKVHEGQSYGGGGLVVWAEIALRGCTDLSNLTGSTLTAVRYRHDIPDQYVRPFLAVLGPDAIFMDDNAQIHRTRVIEQCLQSETLLRMKWPAIEIPCHEPHRTSMGHTWTTVNVTALPDPLHSLNRLRTCLLRVSTNFYW